MGTSSSSCLINQFQNLSNIYGPGHPVVVALEKALIALVETELREDQTILSLKEYDQDDSGFAQ